MSAACAATLTVHVQNVSPKGGIVSLAVFTAANYHNDDHPTATRDVVAVAPETDIRIDGLRPGVYAVKMMQDINRNGKFDTSWIGLPEEPYGFSNDAEPGLDEPDFARASFRVGEGDTVIAIHLSGTDSMSPPAPRRTARR